MSSSKPKTARPPAPRLGREAWLEAALDTLAGGGVGDIRVELLAKTLGVTKGSFYWHFRDRGALLEALLAQWREGRIQAIAAQSAGGGGAPAARLRQIFDLYLDRGNLRGMAIELAIRNWARHDAAAANAVAAVDRARHVEVTALFAAVGFDAREAAARALAFYAFLFGSGLLAESVPPRRDKELRERCARLFMGTPRR
jgi:AcrR family transcriptional regulator